jgi:hypothetical protein
MPKVDELAKSQKIISTVIPANPGSVSGTGAGIQENKYFWTPAFAGVTASMTFCRENA